MVGLYYRIILQYTVQKYFNNFLVSCFEIVQNLICQKTHWLYILYIYIYIYIYMQIYYSTGISRNRTCRLVNVSGKL